MLSLGMWHNFGDDRPFEVQRTVALRAFDLGITHFDLANNPSWLKLVSSLMGADGFEGGVGVGG